MCNLASMGLPTKSWTSLFDSLNSQIIRRPKLLEKVRNDMTSTLIIVWFLENVKYVKIFNHHKLKIDIYSLHNFKHSKWFHILRMRRYRIRWKILTNAEKHKNVWKKPRKSYKIFKGYKLCLHMASHEYYQCETKRKIEERWNKCKKMHLSAVILGPKHQH